MPFDPPTKAEHRRLLHEAMPWCSAKHPILDPQRDLRTPLLEPHIQEEHTFDELD